MPCLSQSVSQGFQSCWGQLAHVTKLQESVSQSVSHTVRDFEVVGAS